MKAGVPRGFDKWTRDEQAVFVAKKLAQINAVLSFWRVHSMRLAQGRPFKPIDMEGRPDFELLKDGENRDKY